MPLTRLGTIAFEQSAKLGVKAFTAVDDKIYVVIGDAFKVISIADPTQPKVLSSLAQQVSSARAMVYTNGYVLIPSTHTGVVTVDVRDPLRPRFVGIIAQPETDWDDQNAEAVFLKGSTLYVASSASSISQKKSFFGITVYDVTDIAHPVFVKNIPLAGITLSLTEIDNTLVVAADDATYLFDITTPQNPSLAYTYDKETVSSNKTDHYAVGATHTHMFVGRRGGIIDTLEYKYGGAPKLIGRMLTPSVNQIVGEPKIKDHFLVVPLQVGGLAVYDIQNPGQPRLAARITTDGFKSISNASISGNILVVDELGYTLGVYDLSSFK